MIVCAVYQTLHAVTTQYAMAAFLRPLPMIGGYTGAWPGPIRPQCYIHTCTKLINARWNFNNLKKGTRIQNYVTVRNVTLSFMFY